jgi:hypothetical protein
VRYLNRLETYATIEAPDMVGWAEPDHGPVQHNAGREAIESE